MSAPRMQHCFYCGEELGVYRHFPEDIESCGKSECQREMNKAYREREAEVREAAENDNYDRYR